eukprot:gene9765-11569_t
MVVERIIGPCEALSGTKVAPNGEGSTEDVPEIHTENACHLKMVENNIGITYVFQLTDALPEPLVYFQFVLTFLPLGAGTRITRVATCQMRTTGSVAEYTRSLSAPGSALVMSKATVVDLQTAYSEGERGDLGQRAAGRLASQLLDTARAFGPEPGARQIRQLPPVQSSCNIGSHHKFIPGPGPLLHPWESHTLCSPMGGQALIHMQ